MKTSKLVAIAWMVFFLPAPGLGSEVFQWTDSSGVIHFTDDYYATPVALRDTAKLIVRTDLGTEQAVLSNTGGSTAIQTNVDREETQDRWASNSENYEPSSRYVNLSSDSFEPPHDVIVVVNDALQMKPCRHSCTGRFKPDFNDRRYIHPSVFNAPSRQYIQPRLFRSRLK